MYESLFSKASDTQCHYFSFLFPMKRKDKENKNLKILAVLSRYYINKLHVCIQNIEFHIGKLFISQKIIFYGLKS